MGYWCCCLDGGGGFAVARVFAVWSGVVFGKATRANTLKQAKFHTSWTSFYQIWTTIIYLNRYTKSRRHFCARTKNVNSIRVQTITKNTFMYCTKL